jgi:hypothetical protein
MPDLRGNTRMFYGDYEFAPVPLFSWGKELVRDSKFDELFIVNTLSFEGILLEDTPSESGGFVLMNQKRANLQSALTASGTQELLITFEGNTIVSGIFPRVNNVNIDAGIWVDRVNYSFQMQYDEGLDPSGLIQSFSETWEFNENEDRRSVSATHNINAVGINTAGTGTNNALTNARDFVLLRTGYINVPPGHPAFVQGSGTLTAFEELRSETADVQTGSFAVVENFTLSSGNFVHIRTGQLQLADDGITTVSLNGNVRGLGRGDTAFPRALNAWDNIFKPRLPADASGIYNSLGGEATLFTSTFQSFSLTQNEFTGTLDYSVSYNDDPSTDLPSGIQDFTLNVQDQPPVRLFASFAIMERSLGNVVQDIGTSTEGRFSITGSAIGKQGFLFDDLVQFVEDEVNAVRPLPASYVTLRLDQQTITKDEDKNTINFSFIWLYTTDLSQAKIEGPVIID